MATNSAATFMAVLQPPLRPGFHHRAVQLHLAIGVGPENFLKAVWRYDVAVAGSAAEDHHRLGEFRLHDPGDFVRVVSRPPIILGS